MVNAGIRMCHATTQANCSRDRNSGSRSMRSSCFRDCGGCLRARGGSPPGIPRRSGRLRSPVAILQGFGESDQDSAGQRPVVLYKRVGHVRGARHVACAIRRASARRSWPPRPPLAPPHRCRLPECAQTRRASCVLICLLAASADCLTILEELILETVELVQRLSDPLEFPKSAPWSNSRSSAIWLACTTWSSASSIPPNASASGLSTSILALAAPVFTPSDTLRSTCLIPARDSSRACNACNVRSRTFARRFSPCTTISLAAFFRTASTSTVCRDIRTSIRQQATAMVIQRNGVRTIHVARVGHPALAFTYRPGAGSMTR